MLKRLFAKAGTRLAGLIPAAMVLGIAPQLVQAASLSPLFSFDQHYTAAGVVQGTGSNAGYLYGSISDSTQTSGGALFRVAITGGAPATIYQLKSTDGYSPRSTLLMSTDGYLYGTTHNSARTPTKITAGGGTVFRIAQDGTGYTTLYDFGGVSTIPSIDDSIEPDYPLIESGGFLFGITARGGANDSGMVFRIRKSDGAFTNLHSFTLATNSDGTTTTGEGVRPSGGLMLGRDGRLYGTTVYGGSNSIVTGSTDAGFTYVGTGTIYSLNVDGSDFQTVYSFPALDGTVSPTVNSVGTTPQGSLIEPTAGVLVGTTSVGGTPTDITLSGAGTVYRFNVATRTATALYNFDGTSFGSAEGRLAYSPTSGLVYGVAGNVFAVKPDGSQFDTVYTFTAADGYAVAGGITLGSDGDLYGAATSGGACTEINGTGYGTVFRYSLTTNGSFSGYSNCLTIASVTSSSGGGAMDAAWLLILGALGMAPPIRRRILGM